MTSKTLLLSSLLATAFICTASIALADYKVATVDVNRVLNETKDAKVKKKQLDEVSLKAKAKVEERQKALKTAEDKLKQSGAAADSKEAEKLQADAREFAHFVKDTDEDLRKEYMKINKELSDKALDIIKKYAETHGVDLVLDKGERGRGPVLFGSAAADITEDVLKSMN
jgi:Skp family chaperone for outer membrane proteins